MIEKDGILNICKPTDISNSCCVAGQPNWRILLHIKTKEYHTLLATFGSKNKA
jgi:hypothetical protein